ncbi:hypothetical protein LX81_02842 [Palleronia aestuarii]|uniref:Sulfatase N-terminal domain-containing protein n=1 Tax=Palleronia aestuarii TaxID=568105 RepID=A0A2W7N327_9RHOB|nr:sulfatase-like hydrolase/transferase [Palleronia aestuarii]PZX14468.1 hypothetical protein LX81_02842 [Palleronia aestuarii]
MRPDVSRGLRAGLAVVLLSLLLPLPIRIGDYTFGHFVRPPVDLAVILLGLVLLPRGTRVLHGLLVAGLAVLTLLRLADLGMIMAFQRGFDPILDLHLLASGWELARGSIGALATIAMIGGAILAFLAVFAALYWSTGALPKLDWPGRIACLGLAAAIGLAGRPAVLPSDITGRIANYRETIVDETRFAVALARDDRIAADLSALAGRDVILLFVESYGRSWLDAVEYRATSHARLEAAEARLRQAGFATRSAWLDAPTRGGQSWLSHATFLSGLRIGSQPRYDALMASDRFSLNRLFARAGWRSVAIMPAITRDWPDAAWYGYDAVFARDDLGYRGQPFEWVTMPDQYTLTALDRLARDDGPVMVEAALISSHAPWTPTPDILPWEEIGDGAIFDGTRRSGATPREVWSDPGTIRAAYSRSLDYTLEIVAQWIARFAEDALVIVVGDHQPAPLVAGQEASATVPIHVIARDSGLLDRLHGSWSDGMLPGPDIPVRPMSEMREMIATCFSSAGCAAPE